MEARRKVTGRGGREGGKEKGTEGGSKRRERYGREERKGSVGNWNKSESYKRYVTIFAIAGDENRMGHSPDQFFLCGKKWSGNETKTRAPLSQHKG